jgi:hypothetical protein
MPSPLPPGPDYLSIPDAFALVHKVAPMAPLFSITRIHWRKRHQVPWLRVGRALYFPKAELEAWARRYARHRRAERPAGVPRSRPSQARPHVETPREAQVKVS